VSALFEPVEDTEGSGLLLQLPYQLGRYTLHRELGAGGMATVYMGRMRLAEGVDRLVAVKTIHGHLAKAQTFVDMFLDEAKIASQISHPNVCSVYDFGNVGGTYFLALEYLMGEPLSDFINQVVDKRDTELLQALPYLAARILADACEGLHAAHETRGPDGKKLDVVHRDVSPQNLFVTYDGAVKVVDFGCAKAIQRVTQTDTGIMKGKVSYAAPEQLRVAALDARADVWALGVCLWETLTLRQLFQQETAIQTAMAVLESPIARADAICDWVPEEIADIADKALMRDPTLRYQSARDMGRDLRKFIARSGTSFESAELAEWMAFLFDERREQVRMMVEAVEAAEAPRNAALRAAAAKTPAIARQESGPIGDAPTKLQKIQSSGDAARPAVASRAVAPEGLSVREPSRRAPRLDEEPMHLPTRKRTGLWAVIAVVLIAGGGICGWMLWQNRASIFGSDPPRAPVARAPQVVEPPPEEPPAVEEPVVEGDPAELSGVSADLVEPVAQPQAPQQPQHAPRDPGPAQVQVQRPAQAPVQVQRPAQAPVQEPDQRPTTNLDTTQGTVLILAEPGWALVFAGDQPLGRTPVRATLPVGETRLRILPYGEEPAQFAVVPVEWGAINRLTVRLAEEPVRPSQEAPPDPEPDPLEDPTAEPAP
jgi:hypothetical protein